MLKVSDVYETLYHYKSWDGLKGILSSQSLWATNYQHLNDSSEIIHFKDYFVDMVKPYVVQSLEKIIKKYPAVGEEVDKRGGIEKVAEKDSRLFVDASYEAVGEGIYIFSFCGPHERAQDNRNGLLSQWKGYGRDGGAALEFETKKLEDLVKKENESYLYDPLFMADVVYSDDENSVKEELGGSLTTIASVVTELMENTIKKIQLDLSRGYHPTVFCMGRYKHYSFHEENEVRIVALPTRISDQIVQMAKNKGETLNQEKTIEKRYGGKTPYIDLFSFDDIGLPIRRIIVGPHVDKEKRCLELKELLKDRDIEVVCSETPFVRIF